jgi:transcription elongation factor GreB
MTRAFVKDADDRPEPEPPRPLSDRPNYVTPHGLAQLRERLARARGDGNDRDARYYDGRVEGAIVVDAAAQPRERVAFGATVTVDTDGREQRYTIVGEDEADPAHGTISWISPLAEALLDHNVGDTAVWHRPVGDAVLRIERIDY